MAAPNIDTRFAGNSTYGGADPWSGDPTKVDPGTPRKAEGFVPDKLPAEWLNWMLNALGAWIYWIAFRLGGLDGSGEWGYDGTRGRVVEFMPVEAIPFDTVSADHFSGRTANVFPLSGAANQQCWIDLTPLLRTGCTVNTVEIIVDPGGASAVTAKLWKYVGGGAVVPTVTQVGTTQSSTGTAAQALTISPALAVTRNTTCLMLEVTSGQASDAVYMGAIAFSDAGPRNF